MTRLLVLLALAGCASHQAAVARRELIGRTEIAALSCLGVPDHERLLSDGSTVVEWTHATKGASASMPLAAVALLPVTLPLSLGDGTISVTGDGDCSVIARIVDGRVASVVFAGASGGISGPDTECKPIVRGCLR